MHFYCAPLEGLTSYQFRTVHHRFFHGVEKYFTPFLSTNQTHNFGNRELREIVPENTAGVPTVPQLLSRVAEDFLWALALCRDMGYTEVNLNLGCPSATVTAKGKGAGFLSDLDALARFFDAVFSKADIAVSVKTRLGMHDCTEFEPLLELYNRYPISELIIHPRVRDDLYRAPVRPDSFSHAVAHSLHPLCYNGDIATQSAYADFTARFPSVDRVMIGRGLIGTPFLLDVLLGKAPPTQTRETLRNFHDTLYDAYRSTYGSNRNTMFRMKELWFYLIHLFDGSEALGKKLRRTTSVEEFRFLTAEIFQTLPLYRDANPCWLPQESSHPHTP
ncbi:MAG: tRNA-dihydrouridine synthase family protein [Oscillospiraceae bacterium]|nr:tRNA-dihydrouridine synthase family protein [Oscillospiraceae bacterium]